MACRGVFKLVLPLVAAALLRLGAGLRQKNFARFALLSIQPYVKTRKLE